MPIIGLDRMPGSGLARGTLFDTELSLTTVNVPNLTATNSIILEKSGENKYTITWTQPSGDDRALSIPVLGADDQFTFNAATQTLTNKAITVTALDAAASDLTIFNGVGANSLTIGAGGTTVVIAGNLTVSGSTTTTVSNTLLVEDSLYVLNHGETGTPTEDSGFIVERGDLTNAGFFWDESADEFVTVNTSSTGTETGNVTIASYANIRVSTLTASNVQAFTLDGKITAGSTEIEGSNFDINGGTVDAITSLTVANNVDVGNYKVTAKALEASDLTSGRITFAGSNGLLADDGDLTFSTDTLTATKIGAFEAAGAINFATQAMTNVNIDSGDIASAVTLNGNAATATALATARTIGGVSFNGTANIVPDTITVADTTDTTSFVALFESATGDLAPKTDASNLTYNATTGILTAAGFVGPLTGNVTGNASGTAATVTGANQASITGAANLVTVGALDAGSITSGFGAINNGSSAITTTGTITGGIITVDNLTLNGNTVSTTDTNGTLILAPHGTGDIYLETDTVRFGSQNENVTLTTYGTGDLLINTNSGTNSGSITMADGVNGNITIAANGTGDLLYTGTGHVGIGIAEPDLGTGRYLTVSGTGNEKAKLALVNPAVSNGSAIGNVSFYSATTDFGGIAYALDSGSTTAGNMKFYTASSSTPVLVMTMLSTGNVGIGTASPTASLSFGSSATINTLSTSQLSLVAGGDLVMSTGATGAMAIKSGALIYFQDIDASDATRLTFDSTNGNMIFQQATTITTSDGQLTIGSDSGHDVKIDSGNDVILEARATRDVVLRGDTQYFQNSSANASMMILNANGMAFQGVTTINTTGSDALTITSAAALNLNPAAGSVILLDGTISIDAGVITGVATITMSGELDAGSLDISGDADIDGTLEADAITVAGTALNEYIADTIGAMVTSNTESGIAVAYQDGDNTLDFTVGTLNQDTTGTAAIASTVTVVDSTDTSSYIAMVDSATGNLAVKTDAGITYNAGTGTLTATAFAGPLTGNVTGNASGTALTVTQAAQSAITSLGTLTALTGGTGDFIWDTNTLVVDSSANRVGIGTTTPDDELEIENTGGQASALISSSNTYSYLRLNNKVGSIGTGVTVGQIQGYNASDFKGSLKISTDATNAAYGSIAFRQATSAGTTDTMTIDGTGSVGIGIAAPENLLHVSGTSNGALLDVLKIDNSGGSAATEVGLVFENGADLSARISAEHSSSDKADLKFWTATAQNTLTLAMTIDDAGAVGINHPNPLGNLTVADEGNAVIYVWSDKDNSGNASSYMLFGTGQKAGEAVTAEESWAVGLKSTTEFVISNRQNNWADMGDTAKFTILTSGNVGIGEAAPATKLHVGEDTGGGGTTSSFATAAVIYGTSSTNAGPLYVNDTTGTGTTAGVGGKIVFGGRKTSSAYEIFSSIQGFKENATSNNYAGGLYFRTAANAGNEAIAMTITSARDVGIGIVPTERLHVYGATGSSGGAGGQVALWLQNGEAHANAYSELIIGQSASASLKLGSAYGSGQGADWANTWVFADGKDLALKSDSDVVIYAGGTAAANIAMSVDSTGVIGIGRASNADRHMFIEKDFGEVDASKYGMVVRPVMAETDGASTNILTGIESQPYISGASFSVANTQNWTATVGVRAIVAYPVSDGASAAGTITGVAGFMSRNGSRHGSGGVWTNQYGMYIENLTTATNNWAIWTQGATPSYFGGNVGINEAAPSSRLEIAGATDENTTLAIRGYGNYGKLVLHNANGTQASPTAVVNAEELGRIQWVGHSTGTGGENTEAGFVRMVSTQAWTGQGSGQNHGAKMEFYTVPTGDGSGTDGQTLAMTVDHNGNVGIGTASPHATARLHIEGNSSDSVDIRIHNTNTTNDNQARLLFIMNDSGGGAERAGVGAKFVDHSDGSEESDLLFWTAYNNSELQERLRIKSDGKVGIGTTTPVTTFDVNGTVGINNELDFSPGESGDNLVGYINFRGYNGGTTTFRDLQIYNGKGSGASGRLASFDGSAGTVNFTGALTAASYADNSDRRLKTNIQTLSSALDKITQLRGVSFDYLVGNKESKIGLIAQEVESVIPEVVSVVSEPVILNEGTSDEEEFTDIKAISYGNLVAYLIESTKELSAKITSLETRLETLEG